MSLARVAVLALIQGMAELLPVSSSAHVIVAEKLMGLDPASPEMTFLLVALHTGTTLAVLLYFARRWRSRWNVASSPERFDGIRASAVATVLTGVVGLVLKKVIEKTLLRGAPHAEIEALFSNMPLIAAALFTAGVLILIAGRAPEGVNGIDGRRAAWIGVVQGLCLPFRGFSRSGATISTGLILGVPRDLAEDFSFGLSVILTPAVVAREGLRLVKAHGEISAALFMPAAVGAALSFIAGLVALKWLSAWLEKGRWSWFGWYCLAASAAVFFLFGR